MPGLFDSLDNWTAQNVILNDEVGPAEQVPFAPASNWNKRQLLPGVVIRDHFQGSNEVRGDGVALNRGGERAVRESILIEFRNCRGKCQRCQDPQTPEQVEIDGFIWSAVRCTGSDRQLQTWLFVRAGAVLGRQGSRGT